MKIVSDTVPIIGLAKIGKIILLKNVANEVIIPPMVYKELFGKTLAPADGTGACPACPVESEGHSSGVAPADDTGVNPV